MTTPLLCSRTCSGASCPALRFPAVWLTTIAGVLALAVAVLVPPASAQGSSESRPAAGDDAGAIQAPATVEDLPGPESRATTQVSEASSSEPSSAQDGLLPLAHAVLARGPVRVAGSIDRATVRREPGGGEAPGYGFELYDAAGARLPVVTRSALPDGFETADAVLVTGTVNDGRLLASQIRVPGASARSGSSLGLTGVMVITLIVWVGLFLYIFRVDRRVHRMEVT